MRRHLPIRLLVCAAMAGSASLAVVAVQGGNAGATPPKTVTCTSLTGSATSQTISGCTGSGAIAADAGTPPAHGTSVASTKTITWSNHKTTKTTYTYHSGSDASCPAVTGYTKDLLENATGSVVSGSATGMVGGAFHGTICVYKKTASPHTLLVKNKGSFAV